MVFTDPFVARMLHPSALFLYAAEGLSIVGILDRGEDLLEPAAGLTRELIVGGLSSRSRLRNRLMKSRYSVRAPKIAVLRPASVPSLPGAFIALILWVS